MVAPNTFQRLFAGQTMGPWLVTNGSVDLIGAGFWQAADGVQSLDLDGAVTPWLPVALGVAGLGGGLVTVPFFTAALANVEPWQTGSAAGLLNAVQQLGGTLGVAAFGAVYLGGQVPTHGLAVAFGLAALLVIALAGSATRMLRPQRTR